MQTFRAEVLEDRASLSVGVPGGLTDFGALRVDPDVYNLSSILVRFRDDAVHGSNSHLDVQGQDFLAGTQIGRDFPLVPGLREVVLAAGLDVQAALAAYRSDARG